MPVDRDGELIIVDPAEPARGGDDTRVRIASNWSGDQATLSGMAAHNTELYSFEQIESGAELVLASSDMSIILER